MENIKFMKRNSWQFSSLVLLLSCILYFPLQAQDDLLDALQQSSDTLEEDGYVEATFKGTRLINGHSVELREKNALDFIISHRFGRLNSGAYELFGLDESTVRIGFDYGLTDRLNIGIGRSSFRKVYDGFLKYKFLRQGEGRGNSPVSAVAFASTSLTTLRSPNELTAANRLSYVFQLLIARKFNDRFSLQLMPGMVHRNLALSPNDDNDIFYLGIGGRYKLTRRVSLNTEYYYLINKPEAGLEPVHSSFAIGVDIETGGHVFQLHLTNSRAMQEKGFITETSGDFFKGDIHYGFNISRVFYF